MTYRLAPRVSLRREERGAVLVADRPLRALRVNERMAAAVERAGAGGREPAGRAEADAWERLVCLGLAERHRSPDERAPNPPSVTVVIPVRDRADELKRCLESLEALRYPKEKLEVVVVDDGSRDASAAVARAWGAAVVPSGGVGRGPGAARNRGAAFARGDVLAFVDSDCRATPGWLEELVGAFSDSAVSAVGGRVEGMHTAAGLDRYEAVMSSLSLGPTERSAQGGDDTFYLPSCNLLVRRVDFAAVGGFRAELHVGEDVDLTWRLRDRGGRICYLPTGSVLHEHRNRLAPFLRRRFQYGTSEGILQALHPRRRKRMVLPPALTLVVALLLLGTLSRGWFPVAAAAALAGADTFRHVRALRSLGAPAGWFRVLRGRLRAAASLGYYLAYHALRYYAVPLAAAGLLFRPASALFAAALFGAAGVDYRVRRPDLSFAAFLVLYLAEQAAYGTGVFWGCWRQGAFTSYRPLFLKRLEMQTH